MPAILASGGYPWTVARKKTERGSRFEHQFT